ncbi:MAG: hypothetical protein DIZ80_17010 [endosymbiont of Galathealinum brachiosum]|uniref:BIG2 domain-containing protein n=1 Tax=endosymbiont of Galathealinum brachiosum TaxID=2200906 RepID=A0A370D8W1_9GAMM|nr:MAG: hypothetical protein DIZ80_17010 [endosymbiont of Galathealinum brachiosum]
MMCVVIGGLQMVSGVFKDRAFAFYLVLVSLFFLSACGDSSSSNSTVTPTQINNSITVPATLELAQKEPFKVVLNDGENFLASCTVSSSDSNVVELPENTLSGANFLMVGLLEGVATVSVNCRYLDGTSDSADVSVTVTSSKLSSIRVTPGAPSLPMNASVQLTATGVFSDATSKDLTNLISWSVEKVESFNTSVGVSVSSTGLASTSPETGGKGIAKITANTVITNSSVNIEGSIELLVGDQVDGALKGQWLYVDSAEKVWLGDYYHLPLTVVNNNLIKFIRTDFETYHLIRAGIPNVQVSGAVGSLGTAPVVPKITVDAFGKISTTMHQALSGIGGVNVILSNISDSSVNSLATTDVDGNFTTQLPSGQYLLRATDGSGNEVETEVTVEGENKNLGDFTLVSTSLYNFKSEMHDDYGSYENPSRLTNEFAFFGTLDGQQEITYNKFIHITNVGTQDVSGLTISLSLDDPDVRSFSSSSVTTGIASGAFFESSVSMSFNRPLTDKELSIDVTLTDINGQSWSDRVNFTLSSAIPVKVSMERPSIITHGAEGYLIAPGLKPVRVTDYASRYIPYNALDSYELVVSTPTVTSETAYGIGFGRDVLSLDVNEFTNTSLNEPTNNDISGATPMSLYTQQVSYMHAGDIDFYTLNFDSVNTPFDPSIISTTPITASDHDMQIRGDYLFLISSSDTGSILDISDISLPLVVNEPGTANPLILNSGEAIDVLDSGNDIFEVFISRSTQLIEHNIDLDLITPTATTTDSVGASDGKDIAYSGNNGNYIYLMDTAAVQIYDVTPPLSGGSAPVNSVAIPSVSSSRTEKLAVSGDYLYVATTNRLNIIFIGDPGASDGLIDDPSIISFVDLPTMSASITDMIINSTATMAYFSSAASSLFAIDISDVNNPFITQQISTNSSCVDMAMIGLNHLYCTHDSGLTGIYDVSDPEDMFMVSRQTINGSDIEVTPNGDGIVAGDNLHFVQFK